MLLLRVLRAVPGSADAVAEAVRGEDLEALFTQAQQHGLTALVRHVVASAGIALSSALEAQARHASMTIAACGLRVMHLLGRTLDELAVERITPVLLKGYGLGARLYPEPLLRPTTDVDLLIAPGELEAATRAVERLSLTRIDDPGYGDYLETHHHRSFQGPAGLVELHYRPVLGFGSALEGEGMRSRSVSAEILKRPVRYLAPEDELVYLAIHATHHLFLKLSWLYDLKLMRLRYPALDWDWVLATAAESGMGPAVHSALTCATRAVGVDFPSRVLDGLSIAPWQRRLCATVFSERELLEPRVAQRKLAAFAVRTLLSQGARRMGRYALAGAVRAGLRAAKPAPKGAGIG